MLNILENHETKVIGGGCCNCYDANNNNVRGFADDNWNYCRYNCCSKNDNYMHYAFGKHLYSCHKSGQINMDEACPSNIDKYLKRGDLL